MGGTALATDRTELRRNRPVLLPCGWPWR